MYNQVTGRYHLLKLFPGPSVPISAQSLSLIADILTLPPKHCPPHSLVLLSSHCPPHSQVCTTFSVNDQPHYQFTPRDLTQWVLGLKRYDYDSLRLPEAVAHEAARVFRDRLVEGAADNFDSLVAAVLNSMINFRCGWGVAVERDMESLSYSPIEESNSSI